LFIETTHRSRPAFPLEVHPPFNLQATVRVLQRRPQNLIDRWIDDHYVRVLRMGTEHVLVATENRGTIDAPDVRYSCRSEVTTETRARIELTLRRVLGLDLDPQRLRRSAGQVNAFDAVSRALRGMRPPRFVTLFEAFANVIPFQQLSLDAGVSIVTRLVERFGVALDCGGQPYFAFPDASTIAAARTDALRACGLSMRKAQTLRDLARLIESGELRESELQAMTTQDALRRLVELPGIGVWSASVVLLRGFGRLDVFPPGDVGAAKGLRMLMGLEPSADIDPIVARFGDQRGYLYFHVLGGSLLERGLIRAAPVDE
jgi:3-methyladenine DNA glycosylase/8-oxoguanine DNA glycosylase